MKNHWIYLLLFLTCCFEKTKGQIPRDVKIAIRWVNKENPLRHYCLNADGLSMSDGKKIRVFVGNCCDYPKFNWNGMTGEIYSEDGQVCIGKSSLYSDVKFTRNFAECASFFLNGMGLLEISGVLFRACIVPDLNDGDSKYNFCTLRHFTIKGGTCNAPTVDSSNLWQHLAFGIYIYCWLPDSFSDGKIVKDTREDCCSKFRFIYKSDRTFFVQSTEEPGEFCLQVDGMPHNKYNELDGKNIKLRNECKGSAFVYDTMFKLLRIEGTDRCLFRTSSNEIKVSACYQGYSYPYSQGTCSATATSIYTVASSVPPVQSTLQTQSSSSSIVLTSSTMTKTHALSSFSSLPLTTMISEVPTSPILGTSSIPMTSLAIRSSVASSVPPVQSTLQTQSSSSSIVLTSSTMTKTHALSSFSSLPLTTMISEVPTSPILATSSIPMTSLAIRSSGISYTTVSVLPFTPIYIGEPVNGDWAQWTQWSSCSVNCGNGIQERSRYCDNPAPRNDGTNCVGSTRETKPCNMSTCSGIAAAKVTENCTYHCEKLGLKCDPAIYTGNSIQPFFDSNFTCSSDDSGKVWTNYYEPAIYINNNKCCGYIKIPSLVGCHVKPPNGIRRLCQCYSKDDAGYYPWTPWSECTKTCNTGSKTRTRLCVNHTMEAETCKGNSSETVDCNVIKCPVDGGFVQWSPWSQCSKSCAGGKRTRNRTCTNPYPAYEGAICYGKYIEEKSCNLWFCPVNGGWSSWTEWQHCNKPCNHGNKTRKRFCDNPLAMYGGIPCQGNNQESNQCNPTICPNITIQLSNVAIDEPWRSEYQNQGGASFRRYEQRIHSNIQELLRHDFLSMISVTVLESLSEGSVIASFTLHFTALDSFQALFLMDAIDNDHYLGKLPIVENKTASFSSPIVPSSPPSNMTAVSNDASSIDVSWNEIPSSDQNGVITGYLVFYRESSATTYTIAATTQLKLKIQGLSAATSYSLRVLAYNSNGNGIASELITLTTREKAPSLPPQSISVVPMSAFSLFVEWTHPPKHSWNGIIAGYKVDIKSDDGSFSQSLNVDGTMVNMNVNGLSPDRLYIVDVCASTSVGTGPCIRSYNKTFVSTPSISPANAGCQNRTSTSSIIVSYEPIPIAFIHGILKGYRIEYRLMSVGSQSKSNSHIQAVTVSPFRKQATLEKLEPNSVYEIRVMAVNEHGAGVKSPVFYGETCSCPAVIYTNYASQRPYIYYDASGNMKGIFTTLLHNITSSICGSCNGTKSKIDYFNDGKNGWADKRSFLQVTRAIDDFVHISFAVPGSLELPAFLGKPYISLVEHPGMVLFTAKPTRAEQIADMMNALFKLWPILAINLLFILLAGIIFWALTFDETPKYHCCSFFSGSLRGVYWAYVTIFTHGYGDITPNTIVSRLFAVIWILIGLVSAAILIGGLTTALTTASVLPDVTLYGTKLATLDGSKERLVGIYRNAIVNLGTKYETVDAVYRALNERKVEAALVDAYVVAGRPDLFSDKAIIARKMIKYSFTYGVVVSGAMENTGANIKNYVSEYRQYIAKMIESTTPIFSVNSKIDSITSLFDPSSSFLRLNLIILCGVLVFLLLLGLIYTCVGKYRAKHRSSKKDFTDKWLKIIQDGIFADLDILCRKIELHAVNQSKRLLKVQRKRYGHKNGGAMNDGIRLGSADGKDSVVMRFYKDERIIKRLDALLAKEAANSRKQETHFIKHF
ncbi:uncharacterized protein LOC135688018 [Rhopilema esculentum]|uniref:uncharacterized protein LOC135688018 n=1 Tax=Rhopilema esculentum TaxID=499914 RepID=UPI0031E118F0